MKNDEFIENNSVKPLSAIVLLNDNYAEYGLQKGYVGTVMSDFIKDRGFIIADFTNPLTGEYINPVAEIKSGDFKVLTNTNDDKAAVKNFKNLLKK